jgi:alkylhydroperoxidase family enzyme
MPRVSIPADVPPIVALMQIGTPELAIHNHTRTWSEAYAQTTLTPREREAWRQRLAHFEGCEHCATVRQGSQLTGEESIPDAFYDNIFNSSWEGYSARERLLIDLIERFAEDHEQLRDDDDFWEEMHANFSDTEIVDVTYHMIGPQLYRALMAKTLLGFTEYCSVQQARTPAVAATTSDD